jgi:hypothetical protein
VASVGAIVNGGELVEVVWTALLAGVGVTCMFAFLILGVTRAADLSRDGRPAEAALFGVVGVVALAVVAAAIVFGIVVMTQK